MKKIADIEFISTGFIKRLSIVLITVMTITGLGQMPLYKRYYVSDIPGLGWLGNYYITHLLHYTGAVILIALAAYLSAEYFLKQRNILKLSKAGWIRIFLLSGLFLSGVLKVISSQKGVYFGKITLLSLDIIHIAFMFALLLSFAVFGFLKSGWFETK